MMYYITKFRVFLGSLAIDKWYSEYLSFLFAGDIVRAAIHMRKILKLYYKLKKLDYTFHVKAIERMEAV